MRHALSIFGVTRIINLASRGERRAQMRAQLLHSRFRHDHLEVQTPIAVPELGYQRASRTDVHALRWYDSWPLVRRGASWIRKVKNAA